MQDLRASFLQRQALREKYKENCEGKKWPYFSDIRRECKQLGRETCNAARNFKSAASEFAEKLQKGEVPEAANSKEYDGVLSAQTVLAKCLREQTLICYLIPVPDGKGGTILVQNCYYDRPCDGERGRVVEEVEKVLGR